MTAAPPRSAQPAPEPPAGDLSLAVTTGQAAFAQAGSLEELAHARTSHLGDRSPVGRARREIGALPAAERAEAGRRVNEVMAALTASHEDRRRELAADRDRRALAEESVDVTVLPGRLPIGSRHPLSTIQEQIADAFLAIGWEVAEGPEVEHEWFNFDALNVPPDHPTRELQDTVWVDPPGSGRLLRTQTSPVQVRSLLERGVPLAIVAPGRTFRNDTLDATHSPVFAQVEGLCVAEGITMAHLRGTLDHFARAVFGPGLASRLRPNYFPFTEPSAEVDLLCFACHGRSAETDGSPCRVCESEGWIEWGGCGMVNPAVLVACGIDPDIYSGFAFGMGLERTLMFRHGITDIRDFYDADVRFSRALGREA